MEFERKRKERSGKFHNFIYASLQNILCCILSIYFLFSEHCLDQDDTETDDDDDDDMPPKKPKIAL